MENDKISWFDLFELDFLERLYTSFQEHINKPNPEETFPSIILQKFLIGLEWDNIAKRLSNLFVDMQRDDVASFLETHCYVAWFPKKNIEGYKFTEMEKSALAGWCFYRDSDEDIMSADQFISEQRSFASEAFYNTVFDWNITPMTKYYMGVLDEIGKRG